MTTSENNERDHSIDLAEGGTAAGVRCCAPGCDC